MRETGRIAILMWEDTICPSFENDVLKDITYAVKLKRDSSMTAAQVADVIESASKEEIASGKADAICLFMDYASQFQKELSSKISVPFLSSSMLLGTWLKSMLKDGKVPSIFTSDMKYIAPRHLESCQISSKDRIYVIGFEDATQFTNYRKNYTPSSDSEYDLDEILNEITGISNRVLEKYSDIGGIILESIWLQRFSSQLKKSLKVPVCDFETLIMTFAKTYGMIYTLF